VTDHYLNLPEGDAVVSVDVKSGIQALDRTQPLLPADFGKNEKRTHDYERNGTKPVQGTSIRVLRRDGLGGLIHEYAQVA